MMASRSQQLIARGDLDENRDVPPRRHRHADERYPEPEYFVELVVQAKTLVFAGRVPALELHDELDALRGASGGDAEQILDVDQPQTAQLHVVARELGARADQNRLGAAADFDRVVGHEPVSADDQIERALALAD